MIAAPLGLRRFLVTDLTPERSSVTWRVSVVTLPSAICGGLKLRASRTGGRRSESGSPSVTGGCSRGGGGSSRGGGDERDGCRGTVPEGADPRAEPSDGRRTTVDDGEGEDFGPLA